jgi:hypothetical protein
VADEADGIVFEAEDEVPVVRDESEKQMTAVESILPWRRKSSFAPDDSSHADDEDNVSLVLKQEEFPAWNKQYLTTYASPSTTVMRALDQDRNPHVHQIFNHNHDHDDGDGGGHSARQSAAVTTVTTDARDGLRARSPSPGPDARHNHKGSSSVSAAADNPAFVPDDDRDDDEPPSTKL